MSKADTLLKKATAFERLALYSDRKTFLQSLSQATPGLDQTSRDLIGKCALINVQAVGETFGAFMSVFRSPFNEFIFNLFQSSLIKKQIDEHLGATINQITNKSLNSFEIPFPKQEEQFNIVIVLKDMDTEIVALEQKLSKYKMLKQGMMQELLTGKIRLV